MPTRIRLQRTRGWRLPEGAVVVARGTRWGNPWRVERAPCERSARHWGWLPIDASETCDDTAEAVRRFAARLAGDASARQQVRDALAGRDLACWCAPDSPCHADLLLEVANRRSADRR